MTDNIRAPKTLKDILELQKTLDEEITKPRVDCFTPRERDIYDIIMSAIAKTVEFNEELKLCTHKNWKKKEYDEKKVLEKLTGILFFLAQLSNYNNIAIEYNELYFPKLGKENSSICLSIKTTSLNLIRSVTNNLIYSSFCEYARLLYLLGYEIEDIYNEYYRKWKDNLNKEKGCLTINTTEIVELEGRVNK